MRWYYGPLTIIRLHNCACFECCATDERGSMSLGVLTTTDASIEQRRYKITKTAHHDAFLRWRQSSGPAANYFLHCLLKTQFVGSSRLIGSAGTSG